MTPFALSIITCMDGIKLIDEMGLDTNAYRNQWLESDPVYNSRDIREAIIFASNAIEQGNFCKEEAQLLTKKGDHTGLYFIWILKIMSYLGCTPTSYYYDILLKYKTALSPFFVQYLLNKSLIGPFSIFEPVSDTVTKWIENDFK